MGAMPSAVQAFAAVGLTAARNLFAFILEPTPPPALTLKLVPETIGSEEQSSDGGKIQTHHECHS